MAQMIELTVEGGNLLVNVAQIDFVLIDSPDRKVQVVVGGRTFPVDQQYLEVKKRLACMAVSILSKETTV